MLTIESLARAVVANWDNGDLAGAVRAMGDHLQQLDQDRLDHEGTITAARSNYAEPSGDDIEIDDVPLVSTAEGGAWVSAWVWVPVE